MIQRGEIVIVTGAPGSGKTTCCAQRITQAQAAGWDVAGVLSPARFVGEKKVGIDGVDLRSGARRALAARRTTDEAAGAVGIVTQRWRFDDAALAWGHAVLAHATPCDLLVVDELGPLEWLQGQGWQAGLAAIDTRAFVTALVVVRPSLLELALARWPAATVLTLTGVPLGGGNPLRSSPPA